MGTENDFQEIAEIRDADLSIWFDAHASAVAAPQWWWSMMEIVEARAILPRPIPVGERRDRLNVGARLLALGVDRGDVTRCLVAYWQLRFAAGALRLHLGISGLAETITPNGAVGWALHNMPASREQAIAYAREREAHDRELGDSLYERPVAGTGSWDKADPHIAALQCVANIIDAFDRIDLSILEGDLRAEAEAWLSVRSQI